MELLHERRSVDADDNGELFVRGVIPAIVICYSMVAIVYVVTLVYVARQPISQAEIHRIVMEEINKQ